MQPEGGGEGFAVGHEALAAPVEQFGHGGGEDVQVFTRVKLARACREATREPEVDAFGGVGGRGVHQARAGPFAGGVAGFFAQLAAGAVQGRLAGVELAGRQLDDGLAQGVTPLVLQHHAPAALSVFQQGGDDGCAGVAHVFAGGRAAVPAVLAARQAHGVALHAQEAALQQRLGGQRLLAQGFVLKVRAGRKGRRGGGAVSVHV